MMLRIAPLILFVATAALLVAFLWTKASKPDHGDERQPKLEPAHLPSPTPPPHAQSPSPEPFSEIDEGACESTVAHDIA